MDSLDVLEVSVGSSSSLAFFLELGATPKSFLFIPEGPGLTSLSVTLRLAPRRAARVLDETGEGGLDSVCLAEILRFAARVLRGILGLTCTSNVVGEEEGGVSGSSVELLPGPIIIVESKE